MGIAADECRDSLLLDCVPLSSGSKVPECFVEGLSVVDECKPATAAGSSLQALMNAGNATDGKDGALCMMDPSVGKVTSSSSSPCVHHSIAASSSILQ